MPLSFRRLQSYSIFSLAALHVVGSLYSAQSPSSACRALQPTEKAQLVRYVIKRYGIPSTVALDVTEQSPASDCYSKVVFAGKGPVGPVSLTLYLSPDHRYLSPDLFDTALDPDVETRDRAKLSLDKLMQGEFASRGSLTAPVVVVEFSDFQCPYCRVAAANIKQDPIVQDTTKVRFVYRHYPLAQHDWAEQAAKAAACSQFQSSASFWKMHDALFSQQESITKTNVGSKIDHIAAGIAELDQTKFKECVDRDMSLGTVLRDKRLGEQLKVNGTPTLFVNGRMIQASELHAAIERELAQKDVATRPPSSSSGSFQAQR